MKKWTRARLLVGVSLGLSFPSAAQAQLLYNAKLDAQAKAALTEYQTMRDAHLAILKDREAAIAALSDKVDRAVIAAVQAERDREVVEVLARPETGAAAVVTRREELDSLLEDRIQQLSGLTTARLRASSGEQRRLLDRAGIATSGIQEEAYRPVVVFGDAEAIAVMGEAHQRYFDKPKPTGPAAGDRRPGATIAGGGRRPGSSGVTTDPAGSPRPQPFTYAEFCKSVPNTVGATPAQQKGHFDSLMADTRLAAIPEGPRKDVAIRLLYPICPRLNEADRQNQLAAGASAGELSPLKALAGIGLTYADVGDSDALEAVDLGLSIEQLRAELALAKASVKSAQDELKTLKREQKALQEAMKGGSAVDVAAAATRLLNIVGKPPSQTAAPPAALAGGDSAATTDADAEADAAPAVDPCSGPVTLACASLLAESYGLANFERARESALIEIAGLLADPKARADAAKANCSPPGPNVNDAQMAQATRICLTRSAMDLLGVGDRAADIAAGRPGELAALAVRIADAQMRIAMAEAKSAALTRRIDNLNAQRAALVNELNILLQAKAYLDEKGSDYRVALLDFGRSVDRGRLAYERASDQFSLIALSDFAAREAQVVKGRYALIDGLLTTITSSTGSGIKPAEIASFLSAIGVTTLGIAEAAQ